MHGRNSSPGGPVLKTSVALPPGTVEVLEKFAGRWGLSRSATLRRLLELGLQQQEKIDRITEAVA